MVPTPPKMQSLDDVKTRIMDETMAELALLAHYLGYGWCASCRAQFVGEDFRRNGDSWEADRKGPCKGYMNHHRLKMHYRDFKFGVKNIVYVESTRTVTHTTTSSWKKTHGVGIELSYTPPDATGGAGVKSSYNFNYEKSWTQTDSTANTQKYTSTVTSTKTLKPFTAAQYRIMLTKTRTTVPYTATIIVHFSAELDGFLRWGGGKDGDSTNYHYEHRGSNRRPTFKYKFGDSSTPFYSALKKQSDRSMRPWEWHEMKARYSNAQPLINALTDESKYEFTLTGQFEDVIGHHVDIHWSTTSLKVPRGFEETLAETHFPKIKGTSPKRVFPKSPKGRLSMSKPHILPLLLNINYDDPDNNVDGNTTDPPRVFPEPPKVDISIKEPQKIPHVPNVDDESELNE
ncbi:aerolysin-5-like [Nematostella vectensis]|uniref:aerolysin-5-like n=1 Tax=Nematostella vectensis TaxID=45351 RepID=UPI0020772476|nr:aerolysin-5-like [Nematostella vectensis]